MAAGCVLSLWRVSLPLTSLIHFNYHNDNCLLLSLSLSGVLSFCGVYEAGRDMAHWGNVYLIFDRLSGLLRQAGAGDCVPLMYLSDPNWIASLLIRLRLSQCSPTRRKEGREAGGQEEDL